MPGLDDRLEQAVRGAAVLPDRDPDAVTAAVAVKHRRRRARRRAATGLAVAMVVVAALTTTVVVVTDRDANDVQVATNETAPPTTTLPPAPTTTVPPEVVETAQQEVAAAPSGFEVEPRQVAVVTENEAVATVTDADGTKYQGVRFTHDDTGWTMAPASACRLPNADVAACADVAPEVRVSDAGATIGTEAYAGVAVFPEPAGVRPEEGYLRGPLVESGSALLAAAYDREGDSFRVRPSRVLALNPATGNVTATVELQGEVLSLVESEGARWAVTHESMIDADRVEYRLKRIDVDTGFVSSNPLPPGSIPTGPAAVGAGSVWVPVHDGVLAFDPASGQFRKRIGLPGQERRGVAVVAGEAYATTGTVIQRLATSGPVPVEDVLDTRTAGVLSDVVQAGDSIWALAVSGEVLRIDSGLTTVEARFELPPALPDATLHANGGQVWVRSTADLTPAGDLTTTSVAVEDVVFTVGENGIGRTILIAGAIEAAATFTTSGELELAAGGDLYRVTLPE